MNQSAPHTLVAERSRRRSRSARHTLVAERSRRRSRSARADHVARALVVLALITPLAAHAEAPWLTARGRLVPGTQLAAWGGSRSAGVGVVVADAADGEVRAVLGAEVLWSHADRDLELRGARTWQLTRTRFATMSVSAGVAAFVVPVGAFDLGAGPHGGLTLSLGGERFAVDLGLQSGVELFVRGAAPRFPQRASMSLNLRLGDFTAALMARLGVDLVPAHFFVGRGEIMLTVGWVFR